MLNGGSMVWGFCVYFVYMIPLETDVLRKHRFQKGQAKPLYMMCLLYSVVLRVRRSVCHCPSQKEYVGLENVDRGAYGV